MPVLEADSFRIVELSDLGVKAAEAERTVFRSPWDQKSQVLYPGVRGPQILEAYVAAPEPPPAEWSVPQGKLRVALRLKDEKPVEGFVDVLAEHEEGRLKPQAFSFDPAKFKAASEEEFAALRKAHDLRLAKSGLPGTLWYKHRGGAVPEDPARDAQAWRDDGMDSTFRMASGGRAVAENLALERNLILGSDVKGEAVDISTLKGITVPAIDWKGKLKAGEVKVDPLAMLVPEDQHFFVAPSLAAVFELRDVLDKEGAPILQSYDVRSPYRGLVARYQEQMGIGNLDAIARTLNLGSVAVTGSDPFFATGTDMTLIFATDKPDLVFSALDLAIGLKAKFSGVAVKEDAGIRSYQTADRSLSAHLAKFEGAVVISNSAAQLKRIAAVAKKEVPALGGLEEYKFFRQRYPQDAAEDAYLFLSDATIRRWCGPSVRIAASRRTRAAAALGELVAAKLDGKAGAESYESLLGKTSEAGGSIRSEIYNTLGFITPSAELEIKSVTPSEAAAYNRWRDGYESGWRRVFDPIAIRLKMDGPKRELDLSVMPLTVDSSYRTWLEFTGRQKPDKGAQAAHEGAKVFFSLAVDHESELFKKAGVELLEVIPSLKANALGWVGDSVSVYLDDAFFWKAVRTGDAGKILEKNYLRLPLGIRISSRSSVQLAVFMTAVKAMVNESAPDLLDWQQRKHGDVTYLAVVSKEAEDDSSSSAAVYYAAMKNALLLSLDEKVLLQAIDRENGKKKEAASNEHVHVAADSDVASLMGMAGESRLQQQRLESWGALPVLNEWHRREPGKDPVALYAAAFREEIRCPGGKGYRWNEAAGTMESVVFGYPAEPRGEEVKFASGPLRLQAGINFEDDGLRLRAVMEPVATPPAAAATADELVVPEGFPQLKDLVPVKEGLELTYQVDETDADGPYTKVMKQLAPESRADGTLIRWQIKRDAEGEEDDDSYQQEQLLSNADKGYATVRTKHQDMEQIFGTPMPVLPAKIAPGLSFSGDYNSVMKSEEGDEKDAGTLRSRVTGLETVEVPAGVFQNCVRIDGEYDYLSGGMIGRVKDTSWYAPGIGMVKSEWKTEFGHGTEVLEKVVKP